MVHDLGTLPLDIVPALLNALDLAVICNRDSAFGRHCFPQKAYEIIACRVPLVAAAVGSMNELLTEYPNCLYEPESANGLAQAHRTATGGKNHCEFASSFLGQLGKEIGNLFPAGAPRPRII